jgi:hypothetical protein
MTSLNTNARNQTEIIMTKFNTTSNTNDIGMFAGLLGCAALTIAVVSGFAPSAAPMITQTMEPIVITAQRVAPVQMATITLAPIVITAPRLTQNAAAPITLEPMIITAKRVVV